MALLPGACMPGEGPCGPAENIHERGPRGTHSTIGTSANSRPIVFDFHWKDKTLDKSGLQLGFIAQEIEKIYPEMVGIGNVTEIDLGNGKKETVKATQNMSYASVVVPLVKAVQEQQAEIETLKAEIESLRAANDNLERRIGNLHAAH